MKYKFIGKPDRIFPQLKTGKVYDLEIKEVEKKTSFNALYQRSRKEYKRKWRLIKLGKIKAPKKVYARVIELKNNELVFFTGIGMTFDDFIKIANKNKIDN